jgi:hypothetical protein
MGGAVAQPVITFRNPEPLTFQQGAWTGTSDLGTGLAPLGSSVLVGAGGAAYLFDAATGQPTTTFPRPPDADPGDFGRRVAFRGDDPLIGDTFGGVGSVYLFDGTTESLLLTIPVPAMGALNVRSLGTLGNDVLVGYTAHVPAVTGAVYLFDGTTGAVLKTFLGAEPEFGGEIAVVAGILAIAPSLETGLPGGTVSIFDPATQALLRTIIDPAADPGARFGVSLATAGSDLLVGAPSNSTPGFAYRFNPATGVLVQTYANPSGAVDGFGNAVVAVGDAVAVGAPGWTEGPAGQVGAVHLFDGATGALLRTLRNPTPEDEDAFGSEIAASGDNVLASAHQDESDGPGPFSKGNAPGAVYLFCGGVAGCGPCETCDAGGGCKVGPHPTCRLPVSPSILRIRDAASNTSDGFTWKWRGHVKEGADFGDPMAGRDYTLCLYDESAPTPTLLFRARARSGSTCGTEPCWTAFAESADFRFRDRARLPDGVHKMQLHSNATQPGRIVAKGVGEHLADRPLGLPNPPLAIPLRVQLQARDGECWEATYTTAVRNVAGRFVARSD